MPHQDRRAALIAKLLAAKVAAEAGAGQQTVEFEGSPIAVVRAETVKYDPDILDRAVTVFVYLAGHGLVIAGRGWNR